MKETDRKERSREAKERDKEERKEGGGKGERAGPRFQVLLS